jgi:hypothetical protein
MSAVLTKESTLQCAHSGAVKLIPTQTKLTVAGNAVMVDGDLSGAPISGCLTVTDPNTSALTCLTVVSASGGVATKLKVGGKGVLLQDVSGQTNGTVGGTPQTWSVKDAGESKLTAV